MRMVDKIKNWLNDQFDTNAKTLKFDIVKDQMNRINQLLDMNKELNEYIELQRTGLIITTALLIVSLIINVVQFYK